MLSVCQYLSSSLSWTASQGALQEEMLVDNATLQLLLAWRDLLMVITSTKVGHPDLAVTFTKVGHSDMVFTSTKVRH